MQWDYYKSRSKYIKHVFKLLNGYENADSMFYVYQIQGM